MTFLLGFVHCFRFNDGAIHFSLLFMSKPRYGGSLIFQAHDEHGVIEVVDSYGVRSLHFGTLPRQSVMSLDEPDRLALPYIRAMLSALIFQSQPKNILLLGLGGGSLAKFLLRHFLDCQLHVIEYRQRVVRVAHDYFGLPEDERLTIQLGDAKEALSDLLRTHAGVFDLALVDVYDHIGMEPSVNTADFMEDCAAVLNPRGVLSINLWGTQAAVFSQSVKLLRQNFPGRLYELTVPNRGNIIGLGLGELSPRFRMKELEPIAKRLECATGLEMTNFLRKLRPIS